jgi:hypothetical protein
VSPVRRVLNATTFTAVAVMGIAVACLLFAIEVNRRPAIDFSEPRVERVGGVSVVEVVAINTTGDARCPEVRIAARDREGVDVADAAARPVEGSDELLAGERRTYRAELTGIDESELDEELDEYAAYVWDDGRCG